MVQLENVKKSLISENTGYSDTIASINAKIANEEKEIASLALALAKAEGTVAEKYVLERIEASHDNIEQLKTKLKQLESIVTQNELCDIEFDLIKQMLSNFARNVDVYNIEEKRAAIKAFVRRVVWDGQSVHMYLFNNNEELDLPLPLNVSDFDENGETLCEYSE